MARPCVGQVIISKRPGVSVEFFWGAEESYFKFSLIWQRRKLITKPDHALACEYSCFSLLLAARDVSPD